MKDTFSLGALILTLLLSLDPVMPKKHYVGPCLVVKEPEPCPDPDFIKVYLYTRKNIGDEQYVEFSEKTDNLTSSNFNPKDPNKIIIHGFNTDMYLDIMQNIKKEYLKQADINVWMVNYPQLVASSWCYLSAAHNIQHVGKCLAQLVTALRRHQSNDIHVIGFSLGGQVTNYIANTLSEKGEDKLDRITGLDPAGPGFTLMSKKLRLDATDAKFVDVVHTNGGVQGDIQPSGHIDFYMNGGVSQPGCFKHILEYFNCNHRRAPIYYAESINSQVGFLAWKCKGFMNFIEGRCKSKPKRVLMGEHCPIGSSGVYVAVTASDKPFALGNRSIESNYEAFPKNEFGELLNNKELTLMMNVPLQSLH